MVTCMSHDHDITCVSHDQGITYTLGRDERRTSLHASRVVRILLSTVTSTTFHKRLLRRHWTKRKLNPRSAHCSLHHTRTVCYDVMQLYTSVCAVHAITMIMIDHLYCRRRKRRKLSVSLRVFLSLLLQLRRRRRRRVRSLT